MGYNGKYADLKLKKERYNSGDAGTKNFGAE
jgi:hypothetical protein